MAEGAFARAARRARLPRRRMLAVGLLVATLVAALVVVLVSNTGADPTPQRDLVRAALGARYRAAHASASRAGTSAAPIIGTNDGSGWGAATAHSILAGHIAWDRVLVGGYSGALETSLSDGFKVLGVVANVPDQEPLSAVDPSEWGAEVVSQLRSSTGVSIAEAGNESYLKGGVANPAQYGRMYMAAIEAMKAAGLHTRLLFNLTGDYPLGTWSEPGTWSLDSAGGGWLRTAVSAVPGLAAAILANGVSVHPYGAVGEDKHDDYGTGSVAALESVASSVLGGIPPFYATEIGWALHRCGESAGACTKREQAAKMLAGYDALIADPHVAGIWWYQSHDDSTGDWGYMTKKSRPRPSFQTLSTIAVAMGQ